MVTKVNGKEYSSISKAIKDNHVSFKRMKAVMIEKGIDEGKAIEYILKTRPERYNSGIMGHKAECTVFGKTYPSRSAACKAYGMHDVNIRYTSKTKGISYDEAFEELYNKYNADGKKYENAGIECTIFGKTYRSRRSACKALNVRYATAVGFAGREHISFNEALERLYNEYNNGSRSKGRIACECTVFGKTYPSRSAACKAYGVNYQSLYNMAIVYMLTFEEEFERYCIKHNISLKED